MRRFVAALSSLLDDNPSHFINRLPLPLLDVDGDRNAIQIGIDGGGGE
jgi:hypothetical protein